MSNDGLSALEVQLAAPAPRGLRSLTDAQLSDLADAVRDVRHAQAAELAAAGDAALRHIPRLLRGPVRKLLCVPRLRGLLASERIDRIIDAAGRDGLTDEALELFGTPTAMRLRPSAR